MPSFDVVSKLQMQEVDNAVVQAQKELGTRYDFRGINTSVELLPEGIMLHGPDDEHLKAALKVLMERCVKRNVSLRALDPGEPQPAAKQTWKQLVKLKQGIATEKGKELVKAIKESKLKVQAQIQDEQVRVTGKNRDDLQAAISLLKRQDFEIDLQFENFRD